MNDSKDFREQDLQTGPLRPAWMIMKNMVFWVFAAVFVSAGLKMG